ncbi:general substrate transporter [Thozetella sp. PMI_491]|nr:general substrate transporter [Thozetella sp. PMI_491]
MAGLTAGASSRYSHLLAEKRIVLICLFIALGQFQYGYDSAAIAGFQNVKAFLEVFGYYDENIKQWNISTDVQRLIQSLMNVGGFVASLIIYALGDRMSRRLGLWVACGFAFLSISIMVGVTSFGGLYAGRLLLGMSNGFFVPYSVTYMAESAPSLLRGSIVGMSTFQLSLGALFGILVDNYTEARDDHTAFQIPLAVMYIVPVAVSILIIFLPDTPRYYVVKGEDDKALNAIRRLRGIKDEALLRAEVEDIKNSYLMEKELHSDVRFFDIFRGSDLRRTLLSYGCAIGQSASGVTFMAGFSVYLFAMAQVGKPFMWVMVSLAITLTANMLAFPAIRYIGRRELLVTCSLISSIMMFGMAIVYHAAGRGTASGKALVGFSIVYTWIYGIGQGPVLWALNTEIPSQRLRSQTVGTASGINFIVAWLVAFFSPYFINPDHLNWGPKYGYIWGASNFVLAVWAFFFIPETKDRSLEQLDELFEKKVPARKFAKFVVERQLVDAWGKEAHQNAPKDVTTHLEQGGKL